MAFSLNTQDADYVVLPRAALFEFFGRMALPPWRDNRGRWIGGDIDCAPIAEEITQWVEANDHPDLLSAIGLSVLRSQAALNDGPGSEA